MEVHMSSHMPQNTPPQKPVPKRYWVFAGNHYYPSGGWKDFQGWFNTILDCVDHTRSFDWYEVVDSETWEVVRTNK